jgi:phenylpyruvate tautomerase PptA (4-oxalocrotonate tautomerase family)
MPTYVCSVPNGKLSDLQKQEIATAIGNRHCEATGAPPFFVQVVVEKQGTSKRFLGGTATDHHIWIRGDIRAGRDEKHRDQIALKRHERRESHHRKPHRRYLGLSLQSGAYRHGGVWARTSQAGRRGAMVRIASVVAQKVSREPRCPSRDFPALTVSLGQAGAVDLNR